MGATRNLTRTIVTRSRVVPTAACHPGSGTVFALRCCARNNLPDVHVTDSSLRTPVLNHIKMTIAMFCCAWPSDGPILLLLTQEPYSHTSCSTWFLKSWFRFRGTPSVVNGILLQTSVVVARLQPGRTELGMEDDSVQRHVKVFPYTTKNMRQPPSHHVVFDCPAKIETTERNLILVASAYGYAASRQQE
jgi:hypothetical protein